MTAPIRDMAGLVNAVRAAQLERELSDLALEALAGVASGSVAKYIGPNPIKKLGPVSTFPLLGALGKALVIVDDPEQIARIRHRWIKRKIVGASARQLKLRAAELASRAGIEGDDQKTLDFQAKLALSERMKQLSKLGASKGGKRRMKMMKKRAMQRHQSHAARKRWAKEQPSK